MNFRIRATCQRFGQSFFFKAFSIKYTSESLRFSAVPVYKKRLRHLDLGNITTGKWEGSHFSPWKWKKPLLCS